MKKALKLNDVYLVTTLQASDFDSSRVIRHEDFVPLPDLEQESKDVELRNDAVAVFVEHAEHEGN
jgi:hypothetical protein